MNSSTGEVETIFVIHLAKQLYVVEKKKQITIMLFSFFFSFTISSSTLSRRHARRPGHACPHPAVVPTLPAMCAPACRARVSTSWGQMCHLHGLGPLVSGEAMKAIFFSFIPSYSCESRI
jgi:hypothetical protein